MKLLFELTASDLLGRNGIIHTSKGKIRTPCFVPVVHPEPTKNLVNVSEFSSGFDVEFIITSSYILKKRFDDTITDLHKLTEFQGPIMTDSGAFQSLVYGEIEFTPESVIKFQEGIGSDFAVPLDLPISKLDSYDLAKSKVDETIKRCQEVPNLIKSLKTLWVGPIQGGKYLDLVEKSSIAVSDIDSFDMFAIGSVVELMNDYQYDTLIDIIITGKKNLNSGKPLHLFGAGHPSMFALIVAAGCDSFDSAAYSLYAQKDRYLTVNQTFQLEELEEFPCNCPVCVQITPAELQKKKKKERMKLLASHNLYVCQAEIKNIRNAVSNGLLWNLIETRSRSHPNLRKGFERLISYSKLLTTSSPSTKKKGIFLTSESDLFRPEIILHSKRLKNLTFNERKKLVLISLLNVDINEIYSLVSKIRSQVKKDSKLTRDYEIWLIDPYFDIVPLEIANVYPLTQFVSIKNISSIIIHEKINLLIDFLTKCKFKEIVLIGDIKKLIMLEKSYLYFANLKVKLSTFGLKISENRLKDIEKVLEFL